MAQATVTFGNVNWSVSGDEAFVQMEYYNFIERLRGLDPAAVGVSLPAAKKNPVTKGKDNVLPFNGAALKAAKDESNTAKPVKEPVPNAKKPEKRLEPKAELKAEPEDVGNYSVLIRHAALMPWDKGTKMELSTLKSIIGSGQGKEVIRPFDEVTFKMPSGETRTAMCACVDSTFARFIFIGDWGKHIMDKSAQRANGYYGSKGRKYILKEIFPKLPEALRAAIRPRQLTSMVGRENFDFEDGLWLPSVGDIFAPETIADPWPIEKDSFQLPIFRQSASCKNRFPELWSEFVLRTVALGDGNVQYGYQNGTFGLAPVPASKATPFIIGFDL